MIVFQALPGGEVIVNEASANTADPVRAYGCADAAAADRDPSLDAAGGHRLGERDDIVGVVVTLAQLMCADVDDFVPLRANTSDEFFLQSVAAVIRGNTNYHEPLPRTRPTKSAAQPLPGRQARRHVPAERVPPGSPRRRRAGARAWGFSLRR